MKYSKSQEVDAMCRQLIDQGWEFVPRGGSRHDKLIAPNGHKVPILREGGDRRTVQNWLHQVARIWTDEAEGGVGEGRSGP